MIFTFMTIKLQWQLMKMIMMTDLLSMKQKGEKLWKKKVGCEFIRIDNDKKESHISKAITKIFRYIKQSTKKTLIKEVIKIRV